MALSALRQHLLGGREQGSGTPSTPRSRHTSLWRPKLGSGTCEPEHGQSQTVLDCSMSKSVHTVHYGLSEPCMRMVPQVKGAMLPAPPLAQDLLLWTYICPSKIKEQGEDPHPSTLPPVTLQPKPFRKASSVVMANESSATRNHHLLK